MKKCPSCKKLYEGYPALSRLDNKTEICSQCGTDEAMNDYIKLIHKTMNVELTKREANIIWHLLYKKRNEWIAEIGNDELTDFMEVLMTKFIFPDHFDKK